MRIAVLGSTGPTGAQIVRQALAAGAEVTAIARRADAFAGVDSHLRVLTRGDIFDPEFLGNAVGGADAVLSALGSHDMRHPTTVYSASTAAIMMAMQVANVRRFICVSALPVTPDGQKLFLNRYLLDPLLRVFFGGGYEDMRRMEEMLHTSALDWTVFRPPYLQNGPATKRYRVALDAPLDRAFTLMRADLAAAMLAAINDYKTFGHCVMIANK